MRRRLLAVPLLLGLLGAAACSDDSPARDDAVAALADRCSYQSGALARLPSPDGIFALSDVAHDAFIILGQGLTELDAEGVSDLDDDRVVQRYLDGVVAANNAMAEVSQAAGFENTQAVRKAVGDAEAAGDELDAAAKALDLPRLCGAKLWGSALFGEADDVAIAEEEVLEPTGDLVDDVGTYCDRWSSAVRRAPEPGGLAGDRAWAFAVGRAVELLDDRLDRLEPPNAQQAAFDALAEAVGDAAATLEPSEDYAADGETAELDRLVREAEADVNRVDALLHSLSPGC